MVDVQFEENQNSAGGIYPLRSSLNRQATSASVHWLIRTGLAQNERSAKYILVAIAVLCFTASAVVIYFSLHRSNSAPVSEINFVSGASDSSSVLDGR